MMNGQVRKQRASLSIRRISPHWVSALPALRIVLSLGLAAALAYGGIRFLSVPRPAGALDFTAHVMGVETSAVGVLGVAASDIDDDGDVDVVTAGLDGVKVYINNDDGTFTAKLVDDVDSERVRVVDLDGDGAQDLLVTFTSAQPSVRWYRNTGEVEFSGTDIGTGGQGKAYAGDIDGDGAPDVVTATTAGEQVTLERWMNNGSGTFTSSTMGTGTGVTAITIADVNANGYNDIITGGSAGLQRWSTADGYSWSRIDIDDSNTGQTYLDTADVNGDGKRDIIAAEPAGDMLLLYRNLDFYAFQRGEVATSVDAVTAVPVDLDEDGDEDIVAAAQDDNSIYWFDNDGSESFTKKTITSSLQSVLGVAVSDLDGDNDFDIVAGDHHRGTVYWYERTAAAPAATAPSSISQSTDGSGTVTFATTVSDGDRDQTKLRVQYSLDGDHWYKPWLTSASTDKGSADLSNGNGYQVGTDNAIDTNEGSVKVTLKWDTQSTLNTGGPIVGEPSSVRLRVIPRDDAGLGEVTISDTFQVDNAAPSSLSGFQVSQAGTDSVQLTWSRATDSNSFTYELYYGTDHAAVLERASQKWDKEDDETMADVDATGTTVTGLSSNTRYSFKLYATDSYGNEAWAPSARAVTASPALPASPAPAPTGPAPASPGASVPASPAASPSPSGPRLSPSPTPKNLPPEADAGEDQVVSSDDLVILNGTDSRDPEGTPLSYQWRQLDGPVVDLSSSDAATSSFRAVGESEVYIFSLVVRDAEGLADSDTVTVVTRALPEEAAGVEEEQEELVEPVRETPPLISLVLRPLDIALFAVSLLAGLISLLERLGQLVGKRRLEKAVSLLRGRKGPWHHGRVVHHRTGEPVVGARVTVYNRLKNVKRKLYTNTKGLFAVALPPGEYTLAVRAEGFAFAPAASAFEAKEGEVVYTGGKLSIVDEGKPIDLVIPLKPTGEAVGSFRARWLGLWQAAQYQGHRLSWPVFIAGSLLNTVLLLMSPGSLFLTLELGYVLLVVAKIVSEARRQPSYGLVRDAVSHVPLGLAVVRLYERGTNRLVMTRVADNRGRFFALPPPGRYTVTVSKPGYAPFTRDNVQITSARDAKLQLKVDLMPVVPQASPAPAV